MAVAVLRFDHAEDGEAFLTWAIEAELQARDLWTVETPFPRYRLIEVVVTEFDVLSAFESFIVSLGRGA